MKIWLLAVIAVSLLMSILISLLPDGGLKKAASTGFGFVYLITLLSPIIGLAGGNFTPETLLDDIMREFAWAEEDTDSAQTEENDYMDKVISEYKKRIERECESSLRDTEGYECGVAVSVEENAAAENFGMVKSVVCTLKVSDAEQDSIVGPVKGIDKIVIDFHGIRAESEADAAADELVGKQQEIAVAVTNKMVSLLGIEEASVNVIFE